MASADAASAPAAAGGEPLHIVSWNVASWATAHRVIAAREGGFAAWWASHPPSAPRTRTRAVFRSSFTTAADAVCRLSRHSCDVLALQEVKISGRALVVSLPRPPP